MEWLIFLVSFLVFITVVGHGLWLLAAFFLRAVSGQPPARRRDIQTELDDLLQENLIDTETHRKVLHATAIRQAKSIARPVPVPPLAVAEPEQLKSASALPATDPWRAEGNSFGGEVPQANLGQSSVELPSPNETSFDEPLVAEVVVEPVQPIASPPVQQDVPAATPSAEPISVRAKRYADARREAAAGDEIEPATRSDATPPRAPKRTWTEWLAAFLEESNIRWGELVGGLLIVSCSTALVISFWSEISARPLLKFGVFNSVIAALFLLGIHAAKKWNLPSTSQGVLLIAMLLVPLNFLAIAAFTKGSQPDAMTIVGELFTIGIFTGLGFVAAKILTPKWPTGTLFGVVGLSAMQLLVRRWCGPDASVGVLRAMSGVIATLYFASHLPVTMTLRRTKHESRSMENDLRALASECWKLIGMVFFAVLLCMSFLLLHSEQPALVLHNISLFGGLIAAPGLIVGSTLLVRSRESQDGSVAVASTAIGIVCTMLLGLGVLFAWPQPSFLLLASFIAFAACSWVSLESGVSFGHYIASAFLALIVLLTGHLLFGWLSLNVTATSETWMAILSRQNGKLMIGAFGIAAAISYGFQRVGWKEDAAVYRRISEIFAVVALSLSFVFGFGRAGDPAGLIWIAGAFGIRSLVIAASRRKGWYVWTGAAMLLAASMQWLTFGFPLFDNWVDRIVTSVLMVVSALSIFRMGYRASGRSVPEIAFEWRTLVHAGTVAAGLMLVCRLGFEINTSNPMLFLWLSAACLATALSERSRTLFDGFQLAALVAAALGLHHWQVAHNVIGIRLVDWLEPKSYYAQTILLSVFAVLSGGLFWLIHRLDWTKLDPQSDDRPSIKELPTGLVASVFLGVAIILSVAGSAYIVAPGVGQELSLVADLTVGRMVPDSSRFQIDQISHSANAMLPWFAWLSVFAGSIAIIKMVPRSPVSDYRTSIKLGSMLCLCPFLMSAAFFDGGTAVASALRWSLAIYFLLGCCVTSLRRHSGMEGSSARALFAFRTLLVLSVAPMAAMMTNVVLQASRFYSPTPNESFWLIVTLLVAVVAAILAIAMHSGSSIKTRNTVHRFLATTAGMSFIFFVAIAVSILSKTLANHPVVGPEPSSVFRRMGLAGSYVTPMVFFAIGFIGTAYRLRSQGLAFVASMLCIVCGTAALLFVRKGRLDECQWIQLAEINSIIAATSVIVWCRWRSEWWPGAGTKSPPDSDQQAADRDSARIVFGIASSFLGLAASAMAALVLFQVSPDLSNELVPVLGLVATTFIAWAGVALRGKPIADFNGFSPIGRLLLLATGLVMLTSFQSPTTVVAYKIFLVGWPLLPLLSLMLERRTGTDASKTNMVWQGLSFGSIIIGCLFALRAVDIRQLSDWWTIGGFAAAALVSSILAIATSKIRFVYIASALAMICANAWWALEVSDHSLPTFIRINLIAWSLPAIVWSMALWKLPQHTHKRTRLQAFVRLVAVLACLGICFITATTLVGGLSAASINSSSAIAWSSLACVFLSVVASAFGGCGLRISSWTYALGLSAVGTYLETLGLPPRDLIWASCLALSAFGLVANYVASRRDQLRAFFDRLVPAAEAVNLHPVAERFAQIDLVSVAALIVAAAVLALGMFTQFTCQSQPIRLVAAQAILAQTFAIALLPVSRWSSARTFALLFAEFGLVAFGWSWIAPDQTRVLDRIVIAAVATATLAFVYAIGLVKMARKENAWTKSAMQLVPWLAGAIVLMIGGVLAIEVLAFVEGRDVVISLASTFAVAGTLLAVAGGCIAFAVWPGRDPLGLKRENLGFYVYAAEFVLAMLFVHFRMSMPWLFTGLYQRIWPLIVMAFAFGGVGFAELVKRLGRIELARPLERTGVFLPLLPAIGIWIVPAAVEFSVVMLVTAILYATLATMRRSFGFGMLAVACGNVGLWHLLNSQGINLFNHPQMWLIPPAVCVLAAASLNRKRLTESQNVAIRYACASTIYVSSTADVFINGVADAPWLPLVLAAFSIAGIFAGILLRVRAFLFLGMSFLMVSLLTVVWHAAVDMQQTWIWYVCGIVAGALILVMFAFFEKKRQSILGTLHQLKEWQA